MRIPVHLTAIPGTIDRDSGLLGPDAEALLSPGFAVLFLPWLKTGLPIRALSPRDTVDASLQLPGKHLYHAGDQGLELRQSIANAKHDDDRER